MFSPLDPMASAQQTSHQPDLCPEPFHQLPVCERATIIPHRVPGARRPTLCPLYPSTWVALLRQLLLLLSWVGVALIEVRGMGCWARKVGEGWIKGGVCPKADPRPLCWLRICW